MKFIYGATTYDFPQLPGKMTMIRPGKINAYRMTHSGVAYFSWGTTIAGREITLEWNALPTTMFESLDTIFGLDTALIFHPEMGASTRTFACKMISLDGEYLFGMSTNSTAGTWRQNVQMTLMITSEVT